MGAATGAHAIPSAGIYAIEVRLARACRITVGRLGALAFDRGACLYVGSALRGLPHRLCRHARREKPLRWHIDYLTAVGHVAGAWVWSPAEGLECRIAARLGGQLPVVNGFGSSDCRCPGHLLLGDSSAVLRIVAPPRIWETRDLTGLCEMLSRTELE